MKDKIVLATHGSQGIVLIRELYGLGMRNCDFTVLTVESEHNKPFIDFLSYIEKEWVVISSKKQLISQFVEYDCNLLLSVSFKYIFPKEVLDKVSVSINFHPGLLPDYRGSFSVPWSIINNEKYVGYTYHLMTKNVDKGRILCQGKIPIDGRDAHTLHYLLFQEGLRDVGKAIRLANERVFETSFMKNDEIGKFYYNKLPYDGEINQRWSLSKIERFIRAMYFPPHKPAFVNIKGEKIYCKSIDEYTKAIMDV